MSSILHPFVPGSIWLRPYPVRYMGTELDARMTVVRLDDGSLLLHSPCEIDETTKQELDGLGPTRYIVAPGTYHYLHVASAQSAFPDAETFICPGIERKDPELAFDWLLADKAPGAWAGQLDQVLVRGSRWMWEVAFFHRHSRTLILVDLVENITDQTAHTNWQLKLWWKAVFHMWNTPKPAPEYQFGWRDKKAARESLRQILRWDFDKVIIAHGDLIVEDARRVVEQAWDVPLNSD